MSGRFYTVTSSRLERGRSLRLNCLNCPFKLCSGWRKLLAPPTCLFAKAMVGLAEASTLLHLELPSLPAFHLIPLRCLTITPSSQIQNKFSFYSGNNVGIRSYLHFVLTLQCGHKIKPLITVVVGLGCLKYFRSWPHVKQFPNIDDFEVRFLVWRKKAKASSG